MMVNGCYWELKRVKTIEIIYCLSCKTVNTRENFWIVYCFTTNQMRNETAEDNWQTTAWISHDLIWNNELALSSTRNLQFSLCIPLKKLFLPQTNTSHLIRSVQKSNYWTDLKVSANLQRYRFAPWAKISQLQNNTDRKPPITANYCSMTFWITRETNTEEHCLWLAHFFSHTV